MPHADAAKYATGLSKEEAYKQAITQTKSLIEGQRNWVCALANASSLLWHAYKALPAPSCHVNWAGFYVVDPSTASTDSSNTRSQSKPSLILGPFHGKVACQTIAYGRGICGRVLATGEPALITDVNADPGHIACDSESASEVVVPIRDAAGRVVGVIDVDCAVVDGFDSVDVGFLLELAGVLGLGCDW